MSLKIARTCLVVAAFILAIAPLFPDLSPTHVFNEDWPPHARFHMVWLLALMVCLGLATIVGAIVLKSLRLLRVLTLSGWVVLFSFFLATVTVNSYGGSINGQVDELMILGLNGNAFGFLIAAIFQTIATTLIWKKRV